MGINLQFAKKFTADKVMGKVMDYVEKDPEDNIIKVLDALKKIALNKRQKEEINLLKKKIKENPSSRKFIKRLSKISENYRRSLIMNIFVNNTLLGSPYRKKLAEDLEVKIPWTILLDPTSACNLNCTGCWAGKYNKGNSLDFETIDRIIEQAKEMGIYFMVFSGGEPTLYPDLLNICEKHDDVGFMMYTNGTLIDEKKAEKMAELGNLTPAISLEGFKEETDKRRGEGTFDKILDTMNILQDNQVLFGSSITVTSKNMEHLFGNDEFIDFLIDQDVIYLWLFHYVPVGKDPDLDLMLTPEQRAELAERISYIRKNKPIFVIDFWNDGILADGCIAGGRRYFHINAQGEVEPCAFAHFSVDNIKEKSLKEVIQNPVFKSFQKNQPFTDNLMAPCPIIDNPDQLRNIVKESGARATHPGADEILKGDIAESLDKIAKSWHQKSNENEYGRKKKGKLANLF